MTDTDKQLGTRWFEEVWNKGRREAIAELLAPDAVLHESGTDSVGPEGFYAYYERMRQALSNVRVTVNDTLIDGDKICLRWTCSCTHTGEGLDFAAAGKKVEVTGISILRVADGKLVEGWQNWDMLGMLQQIRGTARAATYVAR